MSGRLVLIVMRRACLMEDEGRDEFIKVYYTRTEAEAWVKKQKGYFTAADYYIAAAIR